MGNVPLAINAAGIMQGGESFWFLSTERVLLLKKNEQGRWRWVISKFKVDAGLPLEDAARVAARYPWVLDWTPVNEPVTTARFSGLYGHWYPHLCDFGTFMR